MACAGSLKSRRVSLTGGLGPRQAWGMSDAEERKAREAAAREARLAQALRANLRRRKAGGAGKPAAKGEAPGS